MSNTEQPAEENAPPAAEAESEAAVPAEEMPAESGEPVILLMGDSYASGPGRLVTALTDMSGLYWPNRLACLLGGYTFLIQRSWTAEQVCFRHRRT